MLLTLEEKIIPDSDGQRLASYAVYADRCEGHTEASGCAAIAFPIPAAAAGTGLSPHLTTQWELTVKAGLYAGVFYMPIYARRK